MAYTREEALKMYARQMSVHTLEAEVRLIKYSLKANAEAIAFFSKYLAMATASYKKNKGASALYYKNLYAEKLNQALAVKTQILTGLAFSTECLAIARKLKPFAQKRLIQDM